MAAIARRRVALGAALSIPPGRGPEQVVGVEHARRVRLSRVGQVHQQIGHRRMPQRNHVGVGDV